MSRPEDSRDQAPDEAPEDEVAPTPFDNPFFLPVILIAFALWLGYDGFLNAAFIASHQEPDQRWVIGFNQWGAAVCAVLGAYYTWKAIQERRAGKQRSPD